MNTDGNECRRDWYSRGGEIWDGRSVPGTSNWYSSPGSFDANPPPADAGISTHQPPPRAAGFHNTGGRNKRTKTSKIVAITICVVVLIFAAAYALGGSRVEPRQDPGSASVPGGSGQTPFDDFDNYADYFSSYYSGKVSGKNGIAAAQTGTGVTLELKSAPRTRLSYQSVYEKCNPSVVGITARINGNDTGYYWGTGIIFTEDGYIATNYHVLDGTDSVTVTLYDGQELDARLVGYDAASDLAVLKVPGKNLTPAEFGDSSSLRVGDEVVAIGNPLGEDLRATMTNGIISAISRDIDYDGHTLTLLQTNAAIKEGNSGGPLMNMYGQVIGITNLKMMSSYTSIEGIGFAIPSQFIKQIVDDLIEYGYVPGRPALGVTVGPVPSTAASYYTLPGGLYVSAVNENSDAYAKGIRVGDIITEANGTALTSNSDLISIKDTLSVGDSILLTVYREKETFVVDVVLMDQREFADN